MSVVDRAREDIEAGRLWKARDRLTGALVHRPHDAAVLDLLADVYLRMGDAPAAGRILMLTTRDDGKARAARAVFHSLHSGSGYNLAAAVPAKSPVDRYDEAVQERLRDIVKRAEKEGCYWEWPRARGDRSRARTPEDQSRGDTAIGLALATTFVLPWIGGVAFLIAWVAGFVHFG